MSVCSCANTLGETGAWTSGEAMLDLQETLFWMWPFHAMFLVPATLLYNAAMTGAGIWLQQLGSERQFRQRSAWIASIPLLLVVVASFLAERAWQGSPEAGRFVSSSGTLMWPTLHGSWERWAFETVLLLVVPQVLSIAMARPPDARRLKLSLSFAAASLAVWIALALMYPTEAWM